MNSGPQFEKKVTTAQVQRRGAQSIECTCHRPRWGQESRQDPRARRLLHFNGKLLCHSLLTALTSLFWLCHSVLLIVFWLLLLVAFVFSPCVLLFVFWHCHSVLLVPRVLGLCWLISRWWLKVAVAASSCRCLQLGPGPVLPQGTGRLCGS